MLTKAIVKLPAQSMIHGLTEATLGKPNYKKALEQHNNYVQTLKDCGLKIIVLPADEKYPDSVFTEDVAFTNGHFAIIAKPEAISGKGEP
ncbi:MAG: arginine deiminase-related protein [Bacteroidota bacterium]|nr:arginine deiminase-related protein [Bacteroidota bacterium]